MKKILGLLLIVSLSSASYAQQKKQPPKVSSEKFKAPGKKSSTSLSKSKKDIPKVDITHFRAPVKKPKKGNR